MHLNKWGKVLSGKGFSHENKSIGDINDVQFIDRIDFFGPLGSAVREHLEYP